MSDLLVVLQKTLDQDWEDSRGNQVVYRGVPVTGQQLSVIEP